MTALICCGSSCGVLAWGAWMGYLVNEYSGLELLSSNPRADRFIYFNQAEQWAAMHVAAFLPQFDIHNAKIRYRVMYPIEFFCLSLALLLVLDRMLKFSNPESSISERVVVAAIITCNIIASCSSFASAAEHVQTAGYWRKTSAALAANITQDFELSRTNARVMTERSASTASIYFFSEVVALLIMVVSFSAVGFVTLRRIDGLLQAIRASSAAAATGRQLHANVIITTAFIFLTLLLRCTYSIMFTLSQKLQNSSNTCAASAIPSVQNYCSTCFNTCVIHFPHCIYVTTTS